MGLYRARRQEIMLRIVSVKEIRFVSMDELCQRRRYHLRASLI